MSSVRKGPLSTKRTPVQKDPVCTEKDTKFTKKGILCMYACLSVRMSGKFEASFPNQLLTEFPFFLSNNAHQHVLHYNGVIFFEFVSKFLENRKMP